MSDQFLNDLLDDEVPSEEDELDAVVETPAKKVYQPLRQELRNKGYDLNDVEATRQEKSVESMDGYGYLSELWKRLRDKGASNSKISRAVGKDRGMLPAIDDRLETFWFGKRRVVSSECFEEPTFTELLNLILAQKSGRSKTEPKEETISDMLGVYTKKELVALAEARGLELPAKSKKDEIVDLLAQSGITAEELPV